MSEKRNQWAKEQNFKKKDRGGLIDNPEEPEETHMELIINGE